MTTHLNLAVNKHTECVCHTQHVLVVDIPCLCMETSCVREKDIYQLLGQQIANRRRVRKMTQSDLADKVRMSRAAIANIESGRQSVLLHHLYLFASALEYADVSDLLPSMPQGQRESDFVGVAFSDNSISDLSKAAVTDFISNALAQNKDKQ